MARKRLSNDLYIYINDDRIGILTRQATGQLSFQYEADWLQQDNAYPISLSMPLSDIPIKDTAVKYYFDNLLPDSELILQRIQERFNIPTKHSFDILTHIGSDCVGALQLLTHPRDAYEKKINATPIDDKSIAKLLNNYKTAPLGMDKKTDFRISIAGAQEKTALLWHKNQWHLPHANTPTSHIIKLPIGYLSHSGIDLSDSVGNEWLCSKILAEYGLDVCQGEIVNFDDIKTLVVKRFDREWENNDSWLKRIPQEDMCQALGISPVLKYESDGGPGMKDIMTLLRGSDKAIDDRYHFMKSTFLFWLLGAFDGHAKNFSILIKDNGAYQLTPLYDIMSAYSIAEKRQIEWHRLKMAMRVKGKRGHYKWREIQMRHWFSTAKYCNFPEEQMQAIIEEAFDNLDAVIKRVTALLPKDFPPSLAEATFNGMKRVKRLQANKV